MAIFAFTLLLIEVVILWSQGSKLTVQGCKSWESYLVALRSLNKNCVFVQMNPLVEKRMELIPTEEGSDWRDLPNIVSKLSDGSYSQKLIYSYHDVIQVL